MSCLPPHYPQYLELCVGSQQMSCNWGEWTAIPPCSCLHATDTLHQLLPWALCPSASHWSLCAGQQALCAACLFWPNPRVCDSPLLFINTSLSYLLPFPHLWAWSPSPPPPTADVTTATGFNQVPTSIQLLRSAKQHLPIVPACLRGSLLQ